MPMKNPSHSGGLIRTEIGEALGLNASKAAEILKVRRATLSDLPQGKAAVTPEMVLCRPRLPQIQLGFPKTVKAPRRATTECPRAFPCYDDCLTQLRVPAASAVSQ